MKKIFIILLAALMLLPLAACGKNSGADGTDPQQSTLDETAQQNEPADNTAQTADSAVNTEGLVSLRDMPETAIAEALDTFVMSGYTIGGSREWKDYDCTAPDAVEQAYLHMFYQAFGMSTTMPAAFFTENSENVFDDPLMNYTSRITLEDPALIGITPDFPLSYLKIDGEFADAVLRSVFNVEPDHSYVCEETYFENQGAQKMIFYSDGSYYVWQPEAGDYWENRSTVSDIQYMDDGRISVQYRYSFGGDFNGAGYEETDFSYYTAVLGAREVYGKLMWSYYNVSKM